MLVIYVAGPISAPSALGREHNILRAETIALDVLDAGMAPICVHSGARVFWGERAEEIFLQADFEIIGRCDALLLVPGWEKSRGTSMEIAHAHENKIPVFERLDDLKRWVQSCGQRVPKIEVPRETIALAFAIDLGALKPEGLSIGEPT